MSNGTIPTAESVLGYKMGTARRLPEWYAVVDYFEQLAAASDRVELEVLGESTLGKPYIAVTISSPENLARRDQLRADLAQLYDVRGLSAEEETQLVEQAVPTNFLLLSQHSNEIGATLMSLELAAQLAGGEDANTLEILDGTVTVIIPSHNPDGHQLVVEWYKRWLDTEYEGQTMPWLYHHYVDHDNNRDWFMMVQQETRLYVELFNREHPQLVFDMHQMYRDGARFMVPPFIDPLDPNQDPIIQQGFADLGTWIAARLTAEGKAGVATNIIFDNYSPSLAYGNYHGSVDLLSEAASVKLATPIEIKERELSAERGFDPRVRTWNHPMPWKGGEWTLAEIVEYDRIAALAFIEHAARNRRTWLRNYARINRRTVERDEAPYAYVFPPEQDDPTTTYELLDTLQRGAVEIERAEQEFTADGVTFPAGSHVVRLNQPSANFAKTLLEVQRYPDLRQWPGGPPSSPYDITGHTLPLQMGVQAVELKTPVSANLVRVAPERPTGALQGEGEHGFAVSPRTNTSIKFLNALLDAGVSVQRTKAELNDLELPAGTLLIEPGDGVRQAVEQAVAATGVDVRGLNEALTAESLVQVRPRVGLYRAWRFTIDEGWTRWLLEEYGFPYETLHDNDIKQGSLAERFDVIVLPQQRPSDIRDGIPEKNKYEERYPPEYIGGLGAVGAEALRRFVSAGGTLVAIDSAADWAVEELYLPVKNVVAGLKEEEFYCPGSLLRIVVDVNHPLGFGMPRDGVAVFIQSPVYQIGDSGSATAVACYPYTNPNLSGWIMGWEKLAGQAALVEVKLGRGKVVLIGFRAQFRAQARGTYKVLFNAILSGAQSPGAFGG